MKHTLNCVGDESHSLDSQIWCHIEFSTLLSAHLRTCALNSLTHDTPHLETLKHYHETQHKQPSPSLRCFQCLNFVYVQCWTNDVLINMRNIIIKEWHNTPDVGGYAVPIRDPRCYWKRWNISNLTQNWNSDTEDKCPHDFHEALYVLFFHFLDVY